MSLADSLKNLNEFDINDLDVNNAGIWPAPIKAIVLLIVFGLVLGGGYWFFVKDQYAQLDQVKKTETDLRKQYENKAYKVANLDVFKKQMAEMEETFGSLVKQLPS
ncbi:MAG: type 4a pilus biogenesis protein PilO, partial [Marinobacter sp.]|nr:type 4a pilus biogenesis protein PilO [Marinobacter sp.]